jgi:hypothetical protein
MKMRGAKTSTGVRATRVGCGILASCVGLSLFGGQAQAQTQTPVAPPAAKPLVLPNNPDAPDFGAPHTTGILLPNPDAPDPGAPRPVGLQLPEANDPAGDNVSPRAAIDRRLRGVAVADRARPDYDPIPIPVGGFKLLPSLTADTGYQSNVYGSSEVKGDVFGEIIAAAQLNSNWAVNSLDVGGFLAGRAYPTQYKDDDYTYALNASGRYDVTSSEALNAALSTQRVAQSRTSIADTLTTLSPTIYQLSSLELGSNSQFGRFRTYVTGRLATYDYLNAEGLDDVTLDQGYRDYTDQEVLVGAGYDLGGNREWFLSGDYDRRRYWQDASANLRNGEGYQFLTGIRSEITPLIRGQIGLGYINETFDNPMFKSRSGLAVDTSIDYLATELTTVRFTARRYIEDVAIATSAGSLTTRVDLGVDHELYRNLILTGDVSYEHGDYIAITGHADLETIGVGAKWMLDRHYTVTGKLFGARRDLSEILVTPASKDAQAVSTLLGSNVSDFTVTVGITFRP